MLHKRPMRRQLLHNSHAPQNAALVRRGSSGSQDQKPDFLYSAEPSIPPKLPYLPRSPPLLLILSDSPVVPWKAIGAVFLPNGDLDSSPANQSHPPPSQTPIGPPSYPK